MSPILKKYFRLILLFFIILLAFSSPFLLRQRNRYHLQKLEQQLIQEAFCEDTLSLHFAFLSPEALTLSEEPAALPAYCDTAKEDALLHLEQKQEALSHVHTFGLSKEELRRRTLLQDYLSNEQTALTFPLYAEPLSPSSGAQTNLPILLAEYPFRDLEDVNHYLHLLEQIPTYLESLSYYEQKKAAAGLFMSDASAQAVIKQCQDLMNQEKLSDGSHFLCETFASRLENLSATSPLSSEEKELYLAENNRILNTMVAPAYEKLADSLFLLQGKKPATKGLCSLPKGKAYYEFLVSKSTGSTRPISLWKQQLTNRLEEDFLALSALHASHADLFGQAQSPAILSAHTDALFPQAPEEMLTELQQYMEEHFPATSPVPYQVKSVPASLEPYTAPAYYFTPPIDSPNDNTIYINHKQTSPGLPLYTTLAHEGYPGHLYQSVYFEQATSAKQPMPPIYSIYSYGGYVEGWALYVEMLSYDFALQHIQSISPEDENALLSCQLERITRDMQLCLYSLLDIAIHYDGVCESEVHPLLSQFGLSSSTISSLYRYIAEEPANYLKYYIGYLEILECKELAKQYWKEQYSDKAFHQFFLTLGPCRFDTIKKELEATSQ